jgi:hypothetical protein
MSCDSISGLHELVMDVMNHGAGAGLVAPASLRELINKEPRRTHTLFTPRGMRIELVWKSQQPRIEILVTRSAIAADLGCYPSEPHKKRDGGHNLFVDRMA